MSDERPIARLTVTVDVYDASNGWYDFEGDYWSEQIKQFVQNTIDEGSAVFANDVYWTVDAIEWEPAEEVARNVRGQELPGAEAD